MATPDFSKIWGKNSPLAPYTFTDDHYLTGWNFVGSTPPARTMFDAWMRSADEKLLWLYENAFSENSLGGFLFWRLPNTAYFVGEKRALQDGPLDIYLECTVAGKTATTELKKLPAGTDVGITLKDGNVTWIVRKFADVNLLTEHNIDPDAHPNLGLYLRRNSTTYAVGDIAYCRSLPSWARLECVKAGTTGASILNLAEVRKCGVMVTDGNAVWIVDDVRDGARVGDIILRPTLRDGHIKANGATVKASEYPRLLAWVQESNMTVTAEQYQTDCSKYVYDAAQDKLTLPNMTGRVLQGGETVKSVEAGLPQHTHKLNGWVGTSAQKEINSGGFSVVDVATSDTSAGANNPIYGRSDTVQPPALHLIAQIKY